MKTIIALYLVGLTEALSVEAKEFDVKATIVYPGYFNTNFLKEGSMKLAQNPIAAYTAARNTEIWHETQMVGNLTAKATGCSKVEI